MKTTTLNLKALYTSNHAQLTFGGTIEPDPHNNLQLIQLDTVAYYGDEICEIVDGDESSDTVLLINQEDGLNTHILLTYDEYHIAAQSNEPLRR